MRVGDYKLVAALTVIGLCSLTAVSQTSTLVYEGTGGTLEYGTFANQGQTNAVNTVPDFSDAGYKGGGVSIPYIPAVMVITNEPGDDTVLIQNAIDTVEAMPPGTNGFRGALLLKAGTYEVNSTLLVDSSGVVIRGEGSHSSGGTKLMFTATVQDHLLRIAGSGAPSAVGGSTRSITDAYVPVGAQSFNINDSTGYAAGDRIRVRNLMTTNWISDLGMDTLSQTDPADSDWTAAGYQLTFERNVTAVTGNTIYVDAPIVQAIETQYGGGEIFQYTFSSQITNVGVEAIRLESTYTNDTDEAHGWRAVEIYDTRNAWVRQMTAQYFGYAAVHVGGDSHQVTVEDCAMLDPKSQTTGGRKYSFNIDDCTYALFQRCYTRGGRHDLVSGSQTHGPNVFVDCHSTMTFSDIGPHHRYATGQLYDNIKGGAMNVQNRLNSGSGHGWSGAQIMFWNCDASSMICEVAPASMSWAVGTVGNRSNGSAVNAPDGIWESHNTHITNPRSLYYRQLQDRLGQPATRNVMIPDQATGTIWTPLANWAGDGLFGDDVVVWHETSVRAVTATTELHSIVRNLQMLDRGITSAWSKVSGPGNIMFGDATDLSTTAVFSQQGNYTLQLYVDDGSVPYSTNIDILALSPTNTPPLVNAGADQVVEIGISIPWTPAEVSTAVWLDASDVASITESGGQVSQWNDKSGNDNHVTQATPAQRPITGSATIGPHNAISFDPTSQQSLSAPDDASLDLDSSGGANIFAVMNYAGYVSQGSGLNSMLSKGQQLGSTVAYGIRVNSNSSILFKAAANLNSSGGTHTDQDILYSGTRNDTLASSQIFINGDLRDTDSTASISSDNADAFMVGRDGNSSRHTDVDFGEIIVAGNELSIDTRQKMEGYLAHKWGLETNLVGGHPYTSSAPLTEPVAVATLPGTVYDADGDPLTITWSLANGPASVEFADSSATNTTATFTQDGVYTLRLVADDTAVISTNECTVTVVLNDGDSDGMRDLWEVITFGNTTTSDGTGDQDGDGFIDLHEFLAGTAATNDSSLLRVDSTTAISSNQIILTWPGITGKVYHVLSKSNLLQASWFTNTPNVPGVEPITTSTNTVSGPQNYFMIKLD